MKRCPTCNRTFDEEWLGFCTEDGTALVQSGPLRSEPPPTISASGVPTNPSGQPTFNLPGSYNRPMDRPSPVAPLAPGWQPPPPPMRTASPQQGLAIAALVLGIFTVTFGWCYVGVITGIIAIVLGIVSLSQIKNNPERSTGKPLAIAAIVMGAVYYLVAVLIVIIAIIAQA